MAAPNFQVDPSQRGFFGPLRFDADVYDCEVEGTIPSDLNGTFYRVGPNRAYPSRFIDDPGLNGDGQASMFRIKNGHCDYKQRYVHTQRYVAEQQARRALFGYYRNRYTSEPSVQNLSHGTANTHIYWHAGKLMTLKEDSPPVLVDPHTLKTIDNYYTFNGKLTSKTFTAHPKTDLETGEMICYGYEAKGDCTKDIAIYSVDKNGDITWEVWIEAPYVSMMHDMAITPNYILIPTTGFATSMERLKEGKVHWGWERNRPVHVAVIPRGGEARDVRWFKSPERCLIHTINAIELPNNKLVLDSQVSDSNYFYSFFHNTDGSPPNPQAARSTIRRWTMDLNSKNEYLQEDVIFPQVTSSLPRMDDRYIARNHRYGYANQNDPSLPFDEKRAGNLGRRAANALVRFDHTNGQVDVGPVGEVHSAGEVIFAPRKKDSPEGDGYLLATASNYAEMKSELVIMDATNLKQGPLARVLLPFRVTALHGSWVPQWDLDFPDSQAKRSGHFF